jgi:hypothetical protein
VTREMTHVGRAGDGVVPGRSARHPARCERKGSTVMEVPIGRLEDVATAARNFTFTYDRPFWGCEAVEHDLASLEDAIKAYRDARASEARVAEG